MKASLFLAVSGALAVAAGPVAADKRAYATEWVKEIVTVTVTEGYPAPTSVHMLGPGPHKHKATTTYKPKPAPAPVTPVPSPKYTYKAPAPAPSPVKVAAPPPSKPVQDEPAAPSDYPSTGLYHHNIHRANHSSPEVSWDDTLAGYSAATARTCVFQHDM